ncbi:hypothetical protein NDU88_005280 [Pleurodeles waltl]|uniref:Uncharacterized protein n=1 Tax=Pleurodeles waltl TaxID=8319 RepID=A0AAV7NW55_PLEWA|nr:hypothetical protein NDU88_005280 [Pleurodeles waltl]
MDYIAEAEATWDIMAPKSAQGTREKTDGAAPGGRSVLGVGHQKQEQTSEALAGVKQNADNGTKPAETKGPMEVGNKGDTVQICLEKEEKSSTPSLTVRGPPAGAPIPVQMRLVCPSKVEVVHQWHLGCIEAAEAS